MTPELEHIIGPGPVHFIGIGGISMSGLALILLDRGIPVTGSDQRNGELLGRLREKGARISVPHDAGCIGGQTLVVYTAAIAPDNPERTAAKALGIPVMDRARFLGMLAKGYAHTLAVSGTHGKTTSTGMLACILLEADTDPVIQIGGMLPQIRGNTRSGGPDWFLMEACEYKNSYHSFFPTHALILNIEADHLDFFHDLEEIIQSFERFTQNIAPHGTLVLNLDDPGCRKLIPWLHCAFTGYASAQTPYGNEASTPQPQHVYAAADIRYENGCGHFDLLLDDVPLASIRLAVPGAHNVQNALGCFALAHQAGLPAPVISRGLGRFCGTGRRFEYKGTVNGAAIYDDYAHHPSEIEATLQAARGLARGRILCAFQPHTYTRAHELFDAFSTVLAKLDLVVIVDIYAAREPDLGIVHARDITKAVVQKGGRALYAESFGAAAEILRAEVDREDVLLIMGAGDVGGIADLLTGPPTP